MLEEVYSHYINPTTFREYDIRGLIGSTLFAQDAYYIGKSFAQYVIDNSPVRKICIGYDGRISTPILLKELIDGVTSMGVEVFDIGLCPTPMLYYATYTSGIVHGIMITGSHNQPDYNGFKFVFNKKPFFGDNIKNLLNIMQNGFKYTTNSHGKRLFDSNTFDNYVSSIYSSVTFSSSEFKVVWDVSNGSGSKVVQALTSIIPGSHFILNGRIDGTFPGHDPDPTVPKNLKQLKDFLIKEKCDVGIALDGDADRVVVVDSKGRTLQGDQLIAIFAKYMVKKNPSMSVILDIKSSKAVFDYLTDIGCVPLLWKTGHSNIKSKIPEIKAKLAGEVSGHIFFADKYYGFDDGIYGALRVLEILSQGNNIADDLDELPDSFITPEVRIECADDRKFDVINEIKARLIEAKQQFNDIDGLRVDTKDGWWLLRVSNTQPALVIRFEAFEKQGLDVLHAEIKKQLTLSNVKVNMI